MDQREESDTVLARHSLHKDIDNLKGQALLPLCESHLQSPVDNISKVDHKLKHKGDFASRTNEVSGLSAFFMALAVNGILVIIFSIFSLKSVDGEISRLLSSRETTNTQVKGFEKDIHLLHHGFSTLDDIIQRPESQKNVSQHDLQSKAQKSELDEVNALEQRVRALASSADLLKMQVQEASRKEAEQKYGSGVHRVEIQFEFPGNDDGPDTMVIELAPTDFMPHSVHFFLDMVSTGLLERCSFIINALHVLKAATLPYDGGSAAEIARSFTKHGLESVAFREYSESYPHKRYTVGLAGDGSPGFYINTQDNLDIHIGDPCVGKIVDGFNTIERLEKSPTTNGIWLEERIGIKHAKLLPVLRSQ